MKDFQSESLSHCPIHGYIPFVSRVDSHDRESPESDVIDHPWVQRLRQIHQLQTAWWVYPSAEHTRFQHVVGAMHMASRAVGVLYESLHGVCPDVPSRGYVESLMRMAALLHDVGHGPFGHFFDEHFLKYHGLTHEKLGARIILDQLGELLRSIRRNPNSRLEEREQLEPTQIAYLIMRPTADSDGSQPRWLEMLRSLFCGIYTVDNMDFVLRDAFMSGYSTRAFDLDRLLRYSFFTERGLTIHRRGIDALLRFVHIRAQLFRAVYFHRTVRAIDLTLADLFQASRHYLFPGNPLERLDEYCRLTEWSLLVDVGRWRDSDDPDRRNLAPRWQALLERRHEWRMACERNLVYAADDRESASLFSRAAYVEDSLRSRLPADLAAIPLRVDLPRHIYRPGVQGPAAHQNFLYQPDKKRVRPLSDDQLFQSLPVSHRFCRVYVPKATPAAVDEQFAAALDELVGGGGDDDLTNM